MWFRVELHKDGSIASCDAVETTARSGGLVCFIDSANAAAACTAAVAWRQKYLEKKRVSTRASRARRRDIPNRCVCGGPRVDSRFKTCSHCRARVRTGRTGFSTNKLRTELRLLETVLEQRVSLDDEQFRLWLEQEIKWRRQGAEPEDQPSPILERECEVCRARFTARDPGNIYCSKKCNNKARRVRHRAAANTSAALSP